MSKRSGKPLNLEAFLPYRLSIVTNKVSRNLGRLYAEEFNLSIPEWRVMAALGQDNDMSADEVGSKIEMDKVTVSRTVSRLLSKKLITRKFSQADRRRSMIRLSRSGYAIYAQIVPLAISFENELLAALTMQEQRQLDTLLDKLNQRAIAQSV